jgi:hypothetical protein
MIARWFWWRVNAATELASLVATVVLGTFVLIFLSNYEVDGETIDLFGLRVLIMTFGVSAVWIPVAFLTSKQPSKAAIDFHNKMQIGGTGWNAISTVPAELTAGIYEWIIVMALLLCILLGTGKLLFHEWLVGGILIGCAGILLVPFLAILERARTN